MIVRHVQEIVTAGLVLVGGNLVIAQSVPGKTPPTSPYNTGPVQSVPSRTAIITAGPANFEDGETYPGLNLNYGIHPFSHMMSPAPGMPLGTSIDQYMRAQIGNAAVARMTLYDFDFVQGRSQLNYRGRDRLRQLAGRLTATQYPLVVERLPLDPTLATARRAAVLEELTAMGLKVPPDRVVVGPPIAVPLRGVEAEGIYATLMIQTNSAGFQPGLNSAGGGTSSSSGSSGASSGATPTGR
jgi:hypothetical protein